MLKNRLTDKAIKNAKVNNRGRLMLWDGVVADDASLPGSFGLRVTANGVKSWIIMYRIEDTKKPGKIKQQYRKVGSYPSLALAEAREVARDALKMVGKGVDPIKAKEEKKQKVASIKTVNEAVAVFMERHVKKKNRSWHEIERVFDTYVIPKLGDRALPSIATVDIHNLLDNIMDAGHPYMANRLFAHIRKFFNWCAERHWIDYTPTRNIARPADEEARDRILNSDEIKLFWNSCHDLGWPFGFLFKLLLITGQRRNEVSHMRWCDINSGKKLWTMPKEATKSKRQHDVPLSDIAVELLKNVPRNGEFVFSTNGKTSVSGFSKAKKRCDKAISVRRLKSQGQINLVDDELAEAAIPAWRIHDLRRTAASGMAEIGIAPHVIEKVLNHSTGQISGVAAVYNRYAYTEEKRAALTTWAKKLESTVLASDADNVVEPIAGN